MFVTAHVEEVTRKAYGKMMAFVRVNKGVV